MDTSNLESEAEEEPQKRKKSKPNRFKDGERASNEDGEADMSIGEEENGKSYSPMHAGCWLLSPATSPASAIASQCFKFTHHSYM